MKIFLASGNAHKAAELQALANASSVSVEIISARSVGGMPAVAEDTGTFVGNARKKAVALRTRLPMGTCALADDSGLCVDALGGAPGVESAYYAGPQGDGVANLAKLISVMADVPPPDRRAHFACVLFLIDGAGAEHVFEGRCDGALLTRPAGGAGFGYDPLFVPVGYELSFAQLGDEVKNTISHRAQAWSKLAGWLKTVQVGAEQH